MSQEIKTAVDISAATTGGLVWFEWIHPVAGLFTIVWLGISIWQSPTVQKLLKKKDAG
tara:strand:- start:3306 stop:3479 length:174 start_codon:yes stop_codon:yes gene_type:complete